MTIYPLRRIVGQRGVYATLSDGRKLQLPWVTDEILECGHVQRQGHDLDRTYYAVKRRCRDCGVRRSGRAW